MRAIQIVCLAALAAGSALAQGTLVANAPPGSGDFRPFVHVLRDPVPDTTAPWRYFPLAVGNVWEYETPSLPTRVRVTKDTVALGFRYFVIETTRLGASGPHGRSFFRYDTTSATPRQLAIRLAGHPDGPGAADVADNYGCPLDAPFGDVLVECPNRSDVYVDGSYDGVLVFGGDRAGTGTDTVRTPIKVYQYRTGFEYRLAADVGLVYTESHAGYSALTYYRVSGEERGVRQFPTPIEGGPELPTALSLRTWPNPTAGPFTLAIPGGTSGEVVVTDALGRAVARVAISPTVPGTPATVALDLTRLPPGAYLVRVSALDRVTAVSITVLR